MEGRLWKVAVKYLDVCILSAYTFSQSESDTSQIPKCLVLQFISPILAKYRNLKTANDLDSLSKLGQW